MRGRPGALASRWRSGLVPGSDGPGPRGWGHSEDAGARRLPCQRSGPARAALGGQLWRGDFISVFGPLGAHCVSSSGACFSGSDSLVKLPARMVPF